MELNQIIQTDSGELLWLNPQSGVYQVVELVNASRVLPQQENQSDESQVFNDYSDYHNSSTIVKSNVWDKTQTLLFISLCKRNADRLQNPRYKKIEIYKEIAKEMQDHEFHFTAEQCCNKMKTQLCKYKEIKDHNERSGNNPKQWQFYEEMTDYVGDRPGITPIASCSSLSSQNSNPCEMKHQAEKENDGQRKKKVCQRSSPKAEMLKWLRDYRKDVEDREKARLQLLEKQHQENKQIMAEILNILKKNNPEM